MIFELPQIKKKFQFNRLALIIGSLIPDIIDKSLMFLNMSSGRGFSHTILFTFLSSLVVFLITKWNKIISISYYVGTITHLLLDLPDIPLFFPFIYYDFIYIEDPFGSWLYNLLHDPSVYITEIVGLCILIFIIINNKLFNFKKITRFLLENSQKELKNNNSQDDNLNL
ncbi:MAG: metal-dependent hydrolase [Promethearchaeota archaeon]